MIYIHTSVHIYQRKKQTEVCANIWGFRQSTIKREAYECIRTYTTQCVDEFAQIYSKYITGSVNPARNTNTKLKATNRTFLPDTFNASFSFSVNLNISKSLQLN